MKRIFQQGFLSIEVMIVLIVVTAGMGIGMQWLERDSDSKINQATAQQTIAIMDGAAAYIKANYTTVQAAANPLITYTPADIAANLGTNFSTVNPYGQGYSIRVYKTGASKLETMVVTTGGESISDRNLRQIAQLVGAAGGFVSAQDTTKAQGAYGGWTMSFANYGTSPGSGKIAGALFFSDGQLVGDYLYRNAVAGHPEYNQMNTALGMNANDINNVGKLQGKQAALSVDGSGTCCSPAGVTPTLALSENTTGTGRRPTIQFHSAGASEGYIALNGPSEPRRLNFRDNQGTGLGIDTTGQITAPSVKVPEGNNLIVGSSVVYGDSTNTAIRQNGDVYVQHLDGSNSNLRARAVYADFELWTAGSATVGGNINMSSGTAIVNNGRQFIHAAENLYLQPWSGGLTDIAGAGGPVNLASGGGRVYSGTGGMQTRGDLSVANENWGLLLRNSAGQDNAAQQSGVGSAYLNDVFIRSVGRWASQMSGVFRYGGQYEAQWLGNPYGYGNGASCWAGNPATGGCSCPSGYSPQIVGMTYHNSPWDGAGFVCWAN